MSVVRLENIVKQYPKVRALDGVNVSLERGEIHALLGENGAGKSTLMKILYGMTKPDSGQIWIDGKAIELSNPLQAIDLGIGMVHQHFMLADALSVLENIIAGAEPGKGLFIDYQAAQTKLNHMISQFGFSLDMDTSVGALSVGEKQRTEILKVLYRGAKILILDEPTAVLTPLEVEGLFSVLRQLKADGKSIIIITHKLYEVTEIADKITVMRDGKVTGHADPKEITPYQLANLMVGREIQTGQNQRSKEIGAERFVVKDLTWKQKGRTLLDAIDLVIHSGEVVGIAGVEGNGQSELIQVLTGLVQPTTGRLVLDGETLTGDTADFLAKGVGHIPEDRLACGVVEDLSLGENTMLGYHGQERFKTWGLYDQLKIKQGGEQAIEQYRIKAPDADTLIGELSGGNQQKVVIARVLGQTPKVVICAQPTRGVDVGAMEYIHQKIREYRDKENAVLLLSADLQEVMSLSDTIAVMYKGKIVSHAKADAYTDVQLGILMTGGQLSEMTEAKS